MSGEPHPDEAAAPAMTLEAFAAKWRERIKAEKRGGTPVLSEPMTSDEVRELRRRARAYMGWRAEDCARCGYTRVRNGACGDCGMRVGG